MTWTEDPRTAASLSLFMEHLDGVDWYHAPKPPKKHACTAQTRGMVNFEYVERCACSAIRLGKDGIWMEVNGEKGKYYQPKPPQPQKRRRWWQRKEQ